MKYCTLFIITCVFFWCSCTEIQEQGLKGGEFENPIILSQINAIDSLVQQLVQDSATAGISFGIQIGSNKPFVASYGVADMEAQLEVNDSTLFSIASVTKPFTATGIALLIERVISL